MILSACQNLPLRFQLIPLFVCMALASFLIIEMLSISYILGVAFGSKNKINEITIESTKENLQNIVRDVSNLVSRELEKPIVNFLNNTNFGIQDIMFRNDNPYNFYPSYYSEIAFLARPIVFEFGSPVSYSASSFLIPSKSGADVLGLDSETKLLINHIAPLDIFVKSTFLNSTDVSKIFFVLEQNSLFKRYPGGIESFGYNPKLESWYKNSGEKILFDQVFYNSNTKKNVMRISRTIYNPFTRAKVGVMGIDLALTEIKKLLVKSKFSSDSRFLLCDNNGIVLVDSDMDFKPTQENYAATLPNNIWSNILLSDTYFAEHQEFYIKTKKIEINNNFVLISITPNSYVTNIIQPVNANIDNSMKIYAIIVTCLFVAAITFLLAVIGIITSSIVKPLERLAKDAEHITENIGSSDIYSISESSGSYVAETDKLNSTLHNLVNKMRSAQNTSDTLNNELYNESSSDPAELLKKYFCANNENMPSAPTQNLLS